jgi:hypothetical protein
MPHTFRPRRCGQRKPSSQHAPHRRQVPRRRWSILRTYPGAKCTREKRLTFPHACPSLPPSRFARPDPSGTPGGFRAGSLKRGGSTPPEVAPPRRRAVPGAALHPFTLSTCSDTEVSLSARAVLSREKRGATSPGVLPPGFRVPAKRAHDEPRPSVAPGLAGPGARGKTGERAGGLAPPSCARDRR